MLNVVFCSCIESYLQSTYWPQPQPCESSGELEEPVKKKPRRSQVCVSYLDCFHLADSGEWRCMDHVPRSKVV